MFSSLSDAALSSFRWWVSWIAAGGSFAGVLCAVLTIFATREATRRSNIKLAAAEQEARDARTLATKLDLAARPRSLTPEQVARFVAALHDAPRGSIEVQYSSAAEDGHPFAEQIHHAITSAGGYTLTDRIPSVSVFFNGKPIEGVTIKTNRRDNPVAAALQKAFSAAGVDAPGELEEQQTSDAIVTVFRKKP